VEWDKADRTSAAPAATERRDLDPIPIRTVDAELIWIRWERGGPARRPSARAADHATLSVCMVIAWPPIDWVDRIADSPSAAGILRTLIDLFERLRSQVTIVAARSRIEDGRYVGWLSYPDVLAAQDAFFQLRDTLRNRGLTVSLQTRDERIPLEGYGATLEPAISQAS